MLINIEPVIRQRERGGREKERARETETDGKGEWEKKRDITLSLSVCPQVVIEASDEGSPARTVRTSVYVTVRRSTRPPRFDAAAGPAQTRVAEDTRVGTPVFRFDAHDPDLQGELVYAMVGDYPAPSFFSLEPKTGQLAVAADLKSDNLKSEEYTVSNFYIRLITPYCRNMLYSK
jgi:hypothetical protein